MPATEIPPERPPASAPRLERSDLYNPAHWETAYREVHTVPELLIQLQDDLSRSRKREAFWISVVVHLVVVILLWNADRLARFFPMHAVVIKPISMNGKELYLEQPPDRQRVTKRPDTNKISDKDRVAMSKTRIDPKELKKILDSSRPGPPGPTTPAAQQAPQAQAQAAQPDQPKAPPDNSQTANLRLPQNSPPKPRFDTGGLSAGSAVEQAARAALSGGQHYGGGEYGLGQGRQANGSIGPMEILSDTMGVDFGPYLQRVVADVRRNWYNLIPESARAPLMKQGRVGVEFVILKNGQIAEMKLTGPSGDVALDRAAWGGITQSSPFPPLPAEFRGDYLALRFRFFYNEEPDVR
jgi:TonB family protein